MKKSLKINHIYFGNSLEILKDFPDNFIDTVITDPPYGLSNHSEKVIRDVLFHWLNREEDYIPKTKGFMGKSWDAFVPPPALWKEVYRVMKPGATVLVFAGSRTQDLMAMSLRLAGFEIKDTLMWLYGSGFPKATDISKQIDKKLGRKPKVVGRRTNPATPEAKLWNGWKSHGLKPAYEPIIMAMKPNEGSYAENALKWGVAGLNIDAGRIPFKNEADEKESKGKNQHSKYPNSIMRNPAPHGIYHQDKRPAVDYTAKGRFPANILLDEEAAKMLDEQSGVLKAGKLGKKTNGGVHGWKTGKRVDYPNDKGGASRFFYVAKASKRERNMGCEGLEEKFFGQSGGANQALKAGKQEYKRDSIGLNRIKKMTNNHPTVKPLKLMEYLVKLTSMPSPNQIYLDPFLGSGTTVMACKKLNKNWIGIEIDKEYVKIAKARVNAVNRPML